MRAGFWGGGGKVKNTPVSSNAAVEIFFSEPRMFFVDDDSDSPLLGQSAANLIFMMIAYAIC
jgi:hypothetical protein